MHIHHKPAAMTINEFRNWSCLGRTRIYELIGSGELQAIKVGRRTLIPATAAESWLAAQPAFPTKPGRA